MDFLLFKGIEEQRLVCFTGKINILRTENKEFVGSLFLMDGQVINAHFGEMPPLKAVFELTLAYQNDVDSFDLVVEPERLDKSVKKLSYPYLTLKRLLEEQYLSYRKSSESRPPDHLKLLIKPEFIKGGGEVTPKEYSLLAVISDNNLVKDIYEQSELFDHEITELLVNLRKKDALKVVEVK